MKMKEKDDRCLLSVEKVVTESQRRKKVVAFLE